MCYPGLHQFSDWCVPRSRGKGRLRPPRRERRGPDPAYASAPRARGAGRARGARTICTNQSPERQRGSTEPQGSTGLVRGGESRRARAGSGCAAAALWAAIQCRAYLERGVWGVSPCGETLPERRGSRATGPGARGASHENEQRQDSGERARRPEGEGAAAAALPGLCRAWLFRGELLLHPLRGGLAAGLLMRCRA